MKIPQQHKGRISLTHSSVEVSYITKERFCELYGRPREITQHDRNNRPHKGCGLILSTLGAALRYNHQIPFKSDLCSMDSQKQSEYDQKYLKK